MPVYNAEKFLKRSILSVKKQQYENWELLCIDDNSRDRSMALLQAMGKEDGRIKVFQTPCNLGPMGARRLGFEHSTGDYIVYLDADDYLSENYLLAIHKRIMETGADMIFTDLVHLDIGGQHSFFEDHHVDMAEELTGEEGFAETFPWRKFGGLGGYKRQIFEESAYHPYLHGNNFNADEVLQRIMLLKSKKVAFCDGSYYYVDNLGSITHVLQRRSFCRLDANNALIRLAYDYHVPSIVLDKVYSFSFFCQLKALAVSFFQSELSEEDKLYAKKKMKSAWFSYVKYPGVNTFYGTSVKAYLKARIFTINWHMFMALCKIQAKCLK